MDLDLELVELGPTELAELEGRPGGPPSAAIILQFGYCTKSFDLAELVAKEVLRTWGGIADINFELKELLSRARRMKRAAAGLWALVAVGVGIGLLGGLAYMREWVRYSVGGVWILAFAIALLLTVYAWTDFRTAKALAKLNEDDRQ